MDIVVKTHHLGKPGNIKEFAQEKFARLERFHPALRQVEVQFKENGTQMECDVHLVLDRRGTQIICSSAGDLNSAVDLALDRCERQLVRIKEKMRDAHKSGHSERRRAAPAPDAADNDDDDEYGEEG